MCMLCVKDEMNEERIHAATCVKLAMESLQSKIPHKDLDIPCIKVKLQAALKSVKLLEKKIEKVYN